MGQLEGGVQWESISLCKWCVGPSLVFAMSSPLPIPPPLSFALTSCAIGWPSEKTLNRYWCLVWAFPATWTMRKYISVLYQWLSLRYPVTAIQTDEAWYPEILMVPKEVLRGTPQVLCHVNNYPWLKPFNLLIRGPQIFLDIIWSYTRH